MKLMTDRTHYDLLIPNNPFDLFKEIPDGWEVFGAELTYEGDKLNSGQVRYIRGIPEWNGVPIEEMLNIVNPPFKIQVPSKIDFEDDFANEHSHFPYHQDSEFLSRAKNILIPSLLEQGYVLRKFMTVSHQENFHGSKEQTQIRCYEETTPSSFEFTGEWKGWISCDGSAEGLEGMVAFEKYFRD